MLAIKPTLEELRSRLRRLEGGFGDAALRRYVPTGCPALDQALPGRGLPGGALTAIVTAARGAEPAWALAVRIAASALRAAGPEGSALLIDRAGDLYPPGLAALGAPLERLIFVRPARARDGVMALEDGLRSSAIAVAIGELRRPGAAEVQRLALAVEAGGGIGILLAREEDEGALARVPVVLRARRRPEGLSRNNLCIRPAAKPAGFVAPPPWFSPLNHVVVAPCHRASRSASERQGYLVTGPDEGAGSLVGIEVARCRGSLAARGQEVLIDVASTPVHGAPDAAD